MGELKRYRLFLQLFFGVTVLFHQSCSRPAVEIAPWDYTPTTSNEPWKPQDPVEKLSNFIQDPEDLPNKEDLLSLAELVDIALKNNPDTKRTWAQAREAAAQYGISRADYYPNIDFKGDFSRLHQSLGVTESTSANSASSVASTVDSETSYGGNVRLKYTLFDFGVRSSKAEAAMQALNYSNWTHNEQIQNVMKMVSSDYYQYLYNKASLEALRIDMEDAKVSYQAATQKLETGVADVSEMLQARTQFLQKQLQVSAQIGVVENSFVALVKDLGLPPQTEFQLQNFPEHPDLNNLQTSIEKLIETAKSQRPDIIAAQSSVLQAEAKVHEAKAERLPKIDGNVMVGRRWYDQNIGASTNYSLQLELSFPIFAGFLYTNQIRKAEEAHEAALSTLREVELQAIKEVLSYHNDFLTAKDSIVFSLEYFQSAEEEFTSVLSNYEMGTKDILDVLAAQSALADARAQYIRTKKDLFVSITNLSYAIGTLNVSEFKGNQFNFLTKDKIP